ncbi:voltage-gated potassium channel [Lentithecium fluviatile CBS 122367]|uniref:Voltage-gated potassium channel n=1 Tax=Lentithecium fluviatile CBS 122367 TaxID=1168545 RepID=A0A6G1J1N4_9PLEO|nr:voltage-gated potassium channel [Lentithecium fluviatile CBS 122367]
MALILRSDWWFASTGIPLLAATLGPLANVTSIAALVTSWREQIYIDGEFVPEFDGVPFADPRWCYWINVCSLICGLVGNLFLMFNFTQRIRYKIALPVTIILWYLATTMLIAITACMQIYAPPERPYQTYTQGFWYGIAAAVFYLLCSMLLMVNMLGYFLGHYPDNFALSDSQRTLILQTMVFFVWLAGGGAVFSKIESDLGEEGWGFVDAMYFCDVTILTVGFGDLYPTTDLSRGLVFPYSVGGIITLALIVSSIYKFMKELGEENIVQKHIERTRQRTLDRTVTSSFDLRQREREEHHLIRKRTLDNRTRPNISAPTQPRAMHTAMGNEVRRISSRTLTLPLPNPLKNARRPPILLLREEKDRFDAMRNIQHKSQKFKRWMALVFSVAAFGILWCVGAIFFWQAEKKAQGMTYFQALYFCYISLLTIGYGDLSPKSNAGRTFFVIWSLIAVPTMTILVSDMGDTVVHNFKKWSDELADFTVLPKDGAWRTFLEKHPWLLDWIQKWVAERAAKKRLKRGFATADPDDPSEEPASELINDEDPEEQLDLQITLSPNLPILAEEAEKDVSGVTPTLASLSRRLALSIKRVAADLHHVKPKRYEYEEWVEFTRLIRITRLDSENMDEEEEGLIDWDWIGTDSPLMSGLSEAEWLLNRLCESLVRLERKKEYFAQVGGTKRARGTSLPTIQDGDGKQPDVMASGANGKGDGQT